MAKRPPEVLPPLRIIVSPDEPMDKDERAEAREAGVCYGRFPDAAAWLRAAQARGLTDDIGSTMERLRLVGRATLWLSTDRDSGYLATVLASGSLLVRVLEAWNGAREGENPDTNSPVNGGDLVENLGPLMPEVRAWCEGKEA